MRLQKIIIAPKMLNLIYNEWSKILLKKNIINNSTISLIIISLSRIFKPLKMQNLEKKSNIEGRIKLTHFIPINGWLVDILVCDKFIVVELLLYVSDNEELTIDSSTHATVPKVVDNFLSFFFEYKRNKNEINSDKK